VTYVYPTRVIQKLIVNFCQNSDTAGTLNTTVDVTIGLMIRLPRLHRNVAAAGEQLSCNPRKRPLNASRDVYPIYDEYLSFPCGESFTFQSDKTYFMLRRFRSFGALSASPMENAYTKLHFVERVLRIIFTVNKYLYL